MTDRELLELAAKAAGYPISEGYYEESKNGGWWIYIDGSGEPPNDSAWTEIWNPLTDDGDALRLAVRLRIFINIHLEGESVAVTAQSIADSYTELFVDDEMAATRRAIVRAAAEIGKEM